VRWKAPSPSLITLARSPLLITLTHTDIDDEYCSGLIIIVTILTSVLHGIFFYIANTTRRVFGFHTRRQTITKRYYCCCCCCRRHNIHEASKVDSESRLGRDDGGPIGRRPTSCVRRRPHHRPAGLAVAGREIDPRPTGERWRSGERTNDLECVYVASAAAQYRRRRD